MNILKLSAIGFILSLCLSSSVLAASCSLASSEENTFFSLNGLVLATVVDDSGGFPILPDDEPVITGPDSCLDPDEDDDGGCDFFSPLSTGGCPFEYYGTPDDGKPDLVDVYTVSSCVNAGKAGTNKAAGKNYTHYEASLHDAFMYVLRLMAVDTEEAKALCKKSCNGGKGKCVFKSFKHTKNTTNSISITTSAASGEVCFVIKKTGKPPYKIGVAVNCKCV